MANKKKRKRRRRKEVVSRRPLAEQSLPVTDEDAVDIEPEDHSQARKPSLEFEGAFPGFRGNIRVYGIPVAGILIVVAAAAITIIKLV